MCAASKFFVPLQAAGREGAAPLLSGREGAAPFPAGREGAAPLLSGREGAAPFPAGREGAAPLLRLGKLLAVKTRLYC